ncbi:hypothetical protein SC09_Contig24orf00166 [Bacillus subtilis]|uniref:Uncharacterized protein n=1 Tax=Bacillus subtilis TaxID=1423 RepID=A0A0D1IPI5_BACIU|nr:hypothetical protein SC09_Contig24orf00166 [Bacillus subtilis]
MRERSKEALSFFHKCGSHQYRSIQQYEKPGSPFRSGLNANWKLTGFCPKI